VEVQDWYEGGMAEIPLDPKLDGPENIQRYFKRYRKAKGAAEQAGRRLLEVQEQLETLELLELEHEALEPLREGLRQAGLLRKQRGVGRQKQRQTARSPYHRFISQGGAPILVGKRGADNHKLSFQIAKGNDTWLHTRDVPGAHVIIPRQKGAELSSETLLDAAALAAHYSSLRDEPAVDVLYTQRKHLRAIKGAGPGRVSLSSSKTILIRNFSDRIKRLFEDKQET